MITAVTGLNGAGKTAYSAGLLTRWQAKGIPTAANIGVAGSQLVRNFDDLMKLRDCVLLVDEVTAVASSRQFASLTPEALLFFQTLRHSNIGLIWTAPTFDRCDLALRSLTLHWVHVTALITRIPKGGIWANTHLSYTRSGRPMESTDGETKMLGAWPGLYRPAKHHAVYDSYADVDLFTRTQRFPRTCPNCGLSIDYGRHKASTELIHDHFEASYYCPRCGNTLGTVTRPLGSTMAAEQAVEETSRRAYPHPAFGLDSVARPLDMPGSPVAPALGLESSAHPGSNGGLDDDPQDRTDQQPDDQGSGVTEIAQEVPVHGSTVSR